jgi:predicted DNA-binding transcriptional regulator AlpA
MNGYATKRRSKKRSWTVDLNRDRYRELVAEKGWTTQPEQAKGLGLSQATISRIVECDGYPSNKVIAAMRLAFPDEDFDSLFVIVEELPLRRVAA